MQLPPGSIIASGPVIIENDKVLLNKERNSEGRITMWYFPGGEVEDLDASLEEACRREVKEEMGIDIEIIRPLRTLFITRPRRESKAVLVHFLAKRIGEVKPGNDVAEWAWHDIHNLPSDCAPNVYEIIKDYLKETV